MFCNLFLERFKKTSREIGLPSIPVSTLCEHTITSIFIILIANFCLNMQKHLDEIIQIFRKAI